MAALVTLEVGKDHLHITTTVEDDRVMRQIEDASDYILRYLDIYGDPAWTSETVPPVVRSCVLLKLTALHDHLGEDMDGDEHLRDAMSHMLIVLRTPSFA